ncbi:MAG: hypothetical protein J7647_21450 [Cyanobacteria bacterium SBLK]|nr:hypothetical protein [Cyanobacteria bacterium SBLK]
MSQLLEFLTNLAVEPKRQQAFELTPSLAIAQAGLSQVEQAAIASQTKGAIADIFTTEDFQAALVVAVPDEDPIPDPDLPPKPQEEEE